MADNDYEPIVDKRAASRLNAEAGTASTNADAAPTEGADLAAEREKAETYYRNWQRAAADFANYKRRVEQERGESARFASAALVINLLPVFDDFDRAVATVDANLAGLNWVQGIVAIHRKFANMLQAMGVTELDLTDAHFDPAQHEAVARQPGPEGKILHVVQKGYKLNDKILRPAMVIVGDGTA
jgi:molecular chaperone GrpE